MPDLMIEKIYYFFLKLPKKLKYFVLFFGVLFLFSLIRIGFFGSQLSDLSKRIIAFHIPVIDDNPKSVGLFIGMESTLCNDDNFSSRSNNTELAISDHLRVNFGVVTDAYVSVFGIDNNGVYGVYPNLTLSGDISWITGTSLQGKSIQSNSFQLSNLEGNEVIFAIGASKEFQPISSESIISQLKISNAKGPSVTYQLLLDDPNIDVRYINYTVSKRPSMCQL